MDIVIRVDCDNDAFGQSRQSAFEELQRCLDMAFGAMNHPRGNDTEGVYDTNGNRVGTIAVNGAKEYVYD